MYQGRILFVAANPSNTGKLALDQEYAAIEHELRLAPHRDFELLSKWAVTVDGLMRSLNEMEPTVLHFAGHGSAGDRATPGADGARDIAAPDGRRGHGAGIYLQDDAGRPHVVSASALTGMIRYAAASVRLVVLNACFSELLAEALCGVVDCVVGMAGAIDDDAARSFAAGLYRALGNRRAAGNAVGQARMTLAGKQLRNEDLPRCRTREGLDVDHVFLSGSEPVLAPSRPEVSWSQRFDVVIRLALEVRDTPASDAWGIATRAQRAIEHITNHLHEREIGPAQPADSLDAKLRRLKAKRVFPMTIAHHLDVVQSSAASVIDMSGMAIELDPGYLQICRDSLGLAVDWFFRDYVKAPRSRLRSDTYQAVIADTVPDAIPNSTVGTVVNTGSRVGTGLGEPMAIWLDPPTRSTLRIEALDGEDPGQCMFKLEDRGRTYFIGRTPKRNDDTRNDFVVPNAWNSISRDQGALIIEDTDTVLTNTSTRSNVYVRGALVAPGERRVLRHGDAVQFGRCAGTFLDGRYYPAAPPNAVDRRTGLLSRTGLVSEISGVLANCEPRVLFVLRCPDEAVSPGTAPARDPERVAATVALAIHRHDPAIRVARIELDVAALLDATDAVAAVAAVAAAAAGAPCVSGFIPLVGAADKASARLEACLSALRRFAIAGRAMIAPEDLTRHALVPTPVDEFAEHVRPLFALGGGAILFALGELERLHRLIPQTVPVLELELVEMLGGRMGPRELLSVAGPGLVLFGMAGDVERFAEEVGVTWHACEPVTASALEIDRSLSAHLLACSDLENLDERVAALARGNAVFRASGLPAPLSLAARRVNETHGPIERARALVRLAAITWQVLGFVLVASARGVDPADPAGGDAPEPSWPAPWRQLACSAARRLEGSSRVGGLASVVASPDRDGSLRAATDIIADAARVVDPASPVLAEVTRVLPRLEKAVRELLAAIGPLRGWTLIAITGSEVVDVAGRSQRIQYVDYTGPSARGSQQHVTWHNPAALGRFAYLVRWHEGAALALEPYIRRVYNEVSGEAELFLATAPILRPGTHRYRSVASGRELDLTVTQNQLGA